MKRRATDLDCHLQEENNGERVVGNIQKRSLLSNNIQPLNFTKLSSD